MTRSARILGPAEAVRPLASLSLHPQAERVPAMTTAEYTGLLADIRARGVVSPLEISATGVVLDGRHRLRAAHELGLELLPVRVIAPPDEVEHIVLAALNRRHLTASQQAALVIELDSYWEERELAAVRQQAGLRNNGAVVATLPQRAGRSRDYAAELAGCSGRTVQDALFVRDHDSQLFEQLRAGTLHANRARRQIERALRDARLSSPPLPVGPFGLIYADPAWQLGNPASSSAPENHYPTMPLEQIKQLEIPAADDALLYLWAVNSHLPEAIEVLRAWGFDYVGNETWVKPSIVRGVWTRYRHELLLIGRRGNASPADKKLLLDSVIEAPRGRHSEKPAVVYERLEHLYPELSKLELFARGKPRPGWAAWGNEVDPT